MFRSLGLICGGVLLSNAALAVSAQVPPDGPYTWTGTGKIVSGGSTCLGASPVALAGDIVLTGKGTDETLHITSSSDNAAIGAVLKANAYGYSPVTYGRPVRGNLAYLLLPSTTPLAGTYQSKTVAGTAAGTFVQTATLTTGPLTGSGTATCVVTITLTATPGLNKPLMTLLKGVL